LVWADAERLHQVLVNLLTNALAATGQPGTVTVHAGARAATTEELEAGQRVAPEMSPMVVTIAVRDTGVGMPQSDVQRAFQPFFTTKEVGKGTGLGLFLSRETVQARGGTLSLMSEQGRGTTVTISLPGKVFVPEGLA
jgi:signal transduction histidine kinase